MQYYNSAQFSNGLYSPPLITLHVPLQLLLLRAAVSLAHWELVDQFQPLLDRLSAAPSRQMWRPHLAWLEVVQRGTLKPFRAPHLNQHVSCTVMPPGGPNAICVGHRGNISLEGGRPVI